MFKAILDSLLFSFAFFVLMVWIDTRGEAHPTGLTILVSTWSILCFGLVIFLFNKLLAARKNR